MSVQGEFNGPLTVRTHDRWWQLLGFGQMDGKRPRELRNPDPVRAGDPSVSLRRSADSRAWQDLTAAGFGPNFLSERRARSSGLDESVRAAESHCWFWLLLNEAESGQFGQMFRPNWPVWLDSPR